jgi:tRNA(fMet)-specific endonuclease VapC
LTPRTLSAVVRYLLDTNILLAYARGGDLGQWVEATYQLRVSPTMPLVSIVTVGEIWALADKLNWGDPRKRMVADLLQLLVAIPLETTGVIEAYARIDAHNQRIGRPMGQNDMWIAATAHATQATLLTTDSDFDHLNPGFLTHHWINPKTRP